MKNLLFTILVAITIVSCETEINRKIKNDLEKRYEKVEIDEIMPDSSYVYEAVQCLRSFDLQVSESNAKIAHLFNDYDAAKSRSQKILIYNEIDSLYNYTIKSLANFEENKYSRKEKVHRVDYRVAIDGKFIEHNEYYLFNEKNGSIYHRPIDWLEFMVEKDYDKMIKKALRHNSDIMEIKYSLFKKF